MVLSCRLKDQLKILVLNTGIRNRPIFYGCVKTRKWRRQEEEQCPSETVGIASRRHFYSFQRHKNKPRLFLILFLGDAKKE
jgi:hypothetical protein